VRWLTLYSRSRQVPAALLALVVSSAVMGALGQATDNEWLGVVLAVLALALGVAMTAVGLSGADLSLERTAAINWLPRRAAHVLAIGVAVAMAVLATRLAPTEVVLRDSFGLAGLAAFSATVLGGQLAWCLPVAWAGCTAAFPPVSHSLSLRVLTWPMQAPGTTAATVTAIVLGVGGLLTYSVFGCRR
jgi:hypothetical protein